MMSNYPMISAGGANQQSDGETLPSVILDSKGHRMHIAAVEAEGHNRSVFYRCDICGTEQVRTTRID